MKKINTATIEENDNTSGAPIAQDPTILNPTTRGEHIAYWVSQLGSPPMMVLIALTLTSLALSLPRAWVWAGIYICLAVGFPIGYLVWMVRKGKLTDLDVHLREQRGGPMIATLLGLGIAWLVLHFGGAPSYLKLLAGTSLIQTILLAMITLRWKISFHTSTAAGMTVMVLSVLGKPAAPLVITVPLIAWSRVKLRHHTPAQTIAGTALGSAVFLTAILLLG